MFFSHIQKLLIFYHMEKLKKQVACLGAHLVLRISCLELHLIGMRKKYSKTSKALKTYAEASVNTGHITVCSTIYYLVIVFGYINRY